MHRTIQNKSSYYLLLQKVRDEKAWEEWILFILEGVEVISKQATDNIKNIKKLMVEHKHIMRTESEQPYREELLNNIFKHPYTKIDFVMKDLDIQRKTASKYLDELVRINLLTKLKKGRSNYYINNKLYYLLTNM